MNKEVVIKKPIVTEKGTILKDTRNAYVFEVDASATKVDIKRSVEKLFKVKVSKVTTLNQHGHKKRYGGHHFMSKAWKKAYVTLREGKIEIFEGV